MQRTWKVAFEFLNEHGEWVQDYLDRNGYGFDFREADMIKADLAERENIRNVRIEAREW